MEKKAINPVELLIGYIFKDEGKSEELTQMEFLKKTPFFSGMSKRQLKKVIQVLHIRTFREDEYLFEYGNPGAALFFIQSGQVSIEIPSKENLTQVASLGENTFLGEIALLSSEERTASARAMKKTKTLALYRNDLVKLQEMEPEISSEFYKNLAEVIGKRLMTTTKLLSESGEPKLQKESNDAA